MRRTLENLERLTDLRDELDRQLQHLQRQSAGGGALQGPAAKRSGNCVKQRPGGGAVARPAGPGQVDGRRRGRGAGGASRGGTRGAAGRRHAPGGAPPRLTASAADALGCVPGPASTPSDPRSAASSRNCAHQAERAEQLRRRPRAPTRAGLEQAQRHVTGGWRAGWRAGKRELENPGSAAGSAARATASRHRSALAGGGGGDAVLAGRVGRVQPAARRSRGRRRRWSSRASSTSSTPCLDCKATPGGARRGSAQGRDRVNERARSPRATCDPRSHGRRERDVAAATQRSCESLRETAGG
jgi:hypothetical protein